MCNAMLGAAPVEGNQVYFKLFLSMHLSSASIAPVWETENLSQVVPSNTILRTRAVW